MKIQLNGQEREFKDSANLKQIIEQLCKPSVHIIAEHNGKIIKSSQWETTPLNPGDQIELVSIVGGG